MKYRIKIVTYKNGRKAYFAQYKMVGLWFELYHNGETSFGFGYGADSREYALKCIDNHYAGNTKVQTIIFEYINK